MQFPKLRSREQQVAIYGPRTKSLLGMKCMQSHKETMGDTSSKLISQKYGFRGTPFCVEGERFSAKRRTTMSTTSQGRIVVFDKDEVRLLIKTIPTTSRSRRVVFGEWRKTICSRLREAVECFLSSVSYRVFPVECFASIIQFKCVKSL